MTFARPIRVLIVDDQAIVREILERGLSADPELEVVGRARDPFVARDRIVQLQPDVITLDVEMPRMNGVEFLRRLMPQYPVPVVMVSSLTREGRLTTLEALEAGALDFVAKPEGGPGALQAMIAELAEKIKMAAGADLSRWFRRRELRSRQKATEQAAVRSTLALALASKVRCIVLGASTGGTVAFAEILRQLPVDLPGMAVVQHMPAGFTELYARRLDSLTDIEVREATTGDMIVPGRILIAPGDVHMAIKPYGRDYQVNLFHYEKVQGHRPSVDVLFQSAAEIFRPGEAVGVLLTGMGRDGARGLKALRESGARTVAQDEKTSVVYGMPRAAKELDAVEFVEAIDSIPGRLVELVRSQSGVNAAGGPS